VHGSVHASYLHWPVSRRSLPDWFGGCRVTFHLVGRIGLRQTRERLSLGYLLDLMEDVQADVAALDLTRPDLPSIGVSGDIRVRPEQRTAFLDELQRTLQGPVHPLRRCRGRRVPSGRRLLPEGRSRWSSLTCACARSFRPRPRPCTRR
jgi:hypothetical protein